MQYITDLEIHSKYARACSPKSDLEHHAQMADQKGIDLVGTGDFTHPVWFEELRKKLKEEHSGIYSLKNSTAESRFMLTAEVSCIYRKHDATRRIHTLLFAPSLDAVEKLNKKLSEAGGKLGADGRPILGMDIKNVLELILETDERFMMIPAHVWTPWFGFYGSKSGFDSLYNAFEDLTQYIPAIETGLSSDPPMNWRIKELDNKAIVSWSDAHSPANLGREATLIDLESLSYENFYDAIKNGFRTDHTNPNRIIKTIEFYPEEGKYHYDGHRNCSVSLNPIETLQNKGICPKCKKNLTIGVLNRVQEIADRPEGYKDQTRPPFVSLIPLRELIAEAFDVGKNSKRVEQEYNRLCNVGKSEFNILLNLSADEIKSITEPMIADAIQRMREGAINVIPGYDGEYGNINIFSSADREKNKPLTLF